MTTLAPAPLSKQRLRVWLRLLAAQRGIEQRLREALRVGHDCTLPRFDVLSVLDRYRDGLRMSDLSTRLKVSNGNVTGIVERLVGDGLVERVSVDGDRRAMRVRLTPAGIARFAEMAADHETWVNAMLAPLNGADLETLIALLTRIGEDPE
jgi:DNA-binding MarR family transcriptional regulator